MPEPPVLSPIADEPISVILLARNVEPYVQDVIRGWVTQLQKRSQSFEIILVDDGSSDQTRELAETVAQGREEVSVVRHLTRRGLGASLATGLEASTCPLIVTVLCHPDYSPQKLPQFLSAIDDVHFVSGYRAGRKMPTALKVIGWFWRTFLQLTLSIQIKPRPGFLGWRNHVLCGIGRWIFGVRLRDVACPFRMFRREILPRSPIQSRGEFGLVEQLAKVNYLTFLFSEEEIPIDVDPSLGEWQSSWKVLWAEIRNLFSHPDFGPVRFPEVLANESQSEPEVVSEPAPDV